MKRVEFGICGLDVTVPREALKDLFQAKGRAGEMSCCWMLLDFRMIGYDWWYKNGDLRGCMF